MKDNPLAAGLEEQEPHICDERCQPGGEIYEAEERFLRLIGLGQGDQAP